jgi:hypothetical protein
MTGAFVGGLAGVLLPTHLLAIVALGLMIGQGGRLPLVHVALFAVGFLAGCFIIATAIRETPAPLLLLGCAALCGAIVLAAWRPPLALSAALAFIIGILIALNSPPQALTIRAAMVEQSGSASACASSARGSLRARSWCWHSGSPDNYSAAVAASPRLAISCTA